MFAIFISEIVIQTMFPILLKCYFAQRYVVAAGVVGFAYSLLQLPLAIFLVATGKRMIRNGLLLEFDFFGDKVSYSLLVKNCIDLKITIEINRTS